MSRAKSRRALNFEDVLDKLKQQGKNYPPLVSF